MTDPDARQRDHKRGIGGVRDVIRGETQTVLTFLANAKLGLDYYQREYVWTDDHIDQFIDDLMAHMRYWETSQNILPWYLGTVMVHQRGSDYFLVDGQQRCATVLATLLALRERLPKGSVRDDVDLALGIKGKKLVSPMIDRGYQDVFAAKFADPGARDANWTAGQKRIASACDRLRMAFSSWADETDWNELTYSLLHRTILSTLFIRYGELVQEIFIGINSRGARLGQLEQVKNALLGRLPAEERREIGEMWNDIAHRLGGADADRQLNAFAAAAIARYAPEDSFASPKSGTAPADEPALNWLAREGSNPSTASRVGRDLPFFVKAYEGLTMLVQAPDEQLEAPHFLTQCGLDIDHWAPFVLAPLEPHGGERNENARRAAAALAFLDIATARTIWKGERGGISHLREMIHRLTPRMRSASADNLVQRLNGALSEYFPTVFEPHDGLRIGKDHIRPSVARALLTRLTAEVEHWSGAPRGSYPEFSSHGPGGFVIGHLVPGPDDGAKGLFAAGAKPSPLRDRLGALVLIQPELADRLRQQSQAERSATLAHAANALSFLASGDSLSEHKLRTEIDRRGLQLGPYANGVSKDDVYEREASFARIAQEI